MTSERKIYIGLQAQTEQPPRPVGLLKLARRGNIEFGEYAYGKQYLNAPHAYALNPAYLPLSAAVWSLPEQRIRDGGALPLTFRDALPDSWGRKVLETQHGAPLNDLDVLLKTNLDRVGAMVFSEELTMPFAADQQADQAQLISVAELATAVRRLELNMEIPLQMRRLLLKGGTLGGARPKSTFIHAQQRWIAKFPAVEDRHDVELLEYSVLQLAQLCGIEVAPAQLLPIPGGHALLIRRFDRQGQIAQESRLHYLSAAALLNVSYESGDGSYVQFAEVIRKISPNPRQDLYQLYRRMIFNLLLDNTDDHVKNHGMLHVSHGQFRLAPAFDIEMQLKNLGQQELAITAGNARSSLSLALEAAPAFGLPEAEAQQYIDSIKSIIDAQLIPIAAASGATPGLQVAIRRCLARQYELISS